MRNTTIKAMLYSTLLATPVAAGAAGPTGLGELKIGMSKEEVEALAPDTSVHLGSPMTPYEYKNSSPTPGQDKFDTTLVSPLSSTPLEAVLTFSGNSLHSIHVTLDDSSYALDKVKEQISAKYGEPEVDDSMKEEQCLYKNGANFKLKSGVVSYGWKQDRPQGRPIETSLSDIRIDTCPSNLRYAMGALKLKSLTIGVAPEKTPAAPNPF